MTLPEGWSVDKKAENQLPEGWSFDKKEAQPEEPYHIDFSQGYAKPVGYKKPEPVKDPFRDVVSDELRRLGVEPDFSEELERRGELGVAEAFRGLFSGATFGATQNIPGLTTGENPAATTGEVIGSFLPISKLINTFQGPLVKFASKSPILQRQLSSLAEITGMVATGATVAGAEKLTQGEMPSPEDLLEHGALWGGIDIALRGLGLGGRFVQAVAKRAMNAGKSKYGVLNNALKEVEASGVDMSDTQQIAQRLLQNLETPVAEAEIAGAQAAKAIPEALEGAEAKVVTPKELKSRKIDEAPINRLATQTYVNSEPYVPEGINFTKEAEALEKGAIESKLEKAGVRAASEEELGTAIREDIEKGLTEAKKDYKPLYQEAEDAAEELTHTPSQTAKVTGDKLKEISKLSTKPAGYPAVINTLKNVLKDIGYIVQRDKEGAIELIVQDKPVPVKNLIELGRRLNEMINFEAIEPTVKDALKGVVKAVKSDIRVGLGARPDAKAAFELAEEAHAKVADKYGRESVRKIRGQQAGEKIAKAAESPTALKELRETLSPEQMQSVEREFLEKMNSKNFEQAQKMLRESEKHLSAENRKLAREIVESKNPHNPNAKKKIIQDSILDDMTKSITTGERPTKTLNLWKTPKGQKIVKETFHNSPNWPTVKSYLEKQAFSDMTSSVLKDGKLDFKKFNAFMRDPATVNNIRAQGGEEAVTFFRELESHVKQWEKNLNILEKLPTASQIKKGQTFIKQSSGQKRIQKMADKDYPTLAKIREWKDYIKDHLNLHSESSLTVFGMAKLLGYVKFIGVPKAIGALVGEKMFNRLATNPRARKFFLDMAKKESNPFAVIRSLEKFSEEISKED